MCYMGKKKFVRNYVDMFCNIKDNKSYINKCDYKEKK